MATKTGTKSPSMLRLLGVLAAERDVAPSTLRAWYTATRAFVRWCGDKLATPQTVCDRLSEFVAWRASFGSPYSASFYRRTLMGLLRQAEERGLCTLPKRVRPVRIPEHEPVGFSDDEIRMLLCFADPMQRAAILLVRCAALRRGDVFRVRWNQVASDGVLRLVMGKSGRRHSVRLWPEVLDACQQIRLGGDDRLIPYQHNATSWAKAWRKLGERAGVSVKDRGLQAIRRSAASLVAKEYGEVAATNLLGHSTGSGLAVFRRFYAIGEILDQPPPSPPPISPAQ